ncbi:MAG TPA: P-loop NTPase fold protein [Bacteroidia bacterium]|jgi:hypothetical protein|nr:P-loop NTPase fold protein [Bacteroidia bacterium]
MDDRLPKYLSDTPYDEDFFKIHSQIADTIYKIIKSEDFSKHSFTLGLFGKWGSGKSLTIKELKKSIDTTEDIIFVEFDIWKYMDASLYRSILFDFEKQLIESKDKVIQKRFSSGYKSKSENESLLHILNYHRETPILADSKPKNIIQELIDYCKKYWLLKLLIPILKLIDYFVNRIGLIILIAIGVTILSKVIQYKDNVKTAIYFNFSKSVLDSFELLIVFGLGIGVMEFFKEFFKDIFKQILPTDNYTIASTPPTFAQDQFESIFRDFICQLKDYCGKRKIVVVFDNIDRCEAGIAVQALSALKTFMSLPDCFYIIPCDEGEIKKHIGENNNTEGILDKIFQSFIRIPPISEENKYQFIEKCIKNAEFEFTEEDKAKIVQILTYAYKGDTPRQIKRFFNDFISYYRLASTVDPDKKYLIDNVAMFTFMMVIKQKWPEQEQQIIKDPTIIKNHTDTALHANKTDGAKGFGGFLHECKSWIDPTRNPLNYIYIQNVKQSGLIIQKILQEGYTAYELDEPLISEIDNSFNGYYNGPGPYWQFIGKALDNVYTMILANIGKSSTHIINVLFKCYWGNIYRYDKWVGNEKPDGPSFVVKHVNLFTKHPDLINRLDANLVNGAQKHCVEILWKEGPDHSMKNLISAFSKYFKPEIVKGIFKIVNPGDIIRLQNYITAFPLEQTSKFVPYEYVVKLINAMDLMNDQGGVCNKIEFLLRTDLRPHVTELLPQKIANSGIESIINTRQIVPADNNIINFLKLLTKDELLKSIEKQRFDDDIYKRGRITLSATYSDTAVDYIIQALRLVSTEPSINALMQDLRTFNVQLIGHTNTHNHLLRRINSNEMVEILLGPFREIILQNAQRDKNLTNIYSTLPIAFIDENLTLLANQNLNDSTSILLEVLSTRKGISNEDIDKIVKIENRIKSL